MFKSKQKRVEEYEKLYEKVNGHWVVVVKINDSVEKLDFNKKAKFLDTWGNECYSFNVCKEGQSLGVIPKKNVCYIF